MKKIASVLLGLLLISSVSFTSCDKDDDKKSCDELEATLLIKALEFWGVESNSNCEAYKSALQEYVNDCDEITAEDLLEYQAELDTLDCSIYH